MFGKVFAVILSLLMVWYAAAQMDRLDTGQKFSGIRVLESGEAEQADEEAAQGQIQVTAALREMQESKTVTVRFILEGNGNTYRNVVTLTPESGKKQGMLTAETVYENLVSGVYTLQIESISGASFDYIIAENGDASKYVIEGEKITFELMPGAEYGSAWFMLQEGELT